MRDHLSSLQWQYPISVHVTLPHFFLPLAMVSRGETKKGREKTMARIRFSPGDNSFLLHRPDRMDLTSRVRRGDFCRFLVVQHKSANGIALSRRAIERELNLKMRKISFGIREPEWHKRFYFVFNEKKSIRITLSVAWSEEKLKFVKR